MAQDQDFSGKVALVTGVASGIGAACAKALDQRGAQRLVLVDVDGDGLDALELECQAVRYTGSVADPALWSRIEADQGRIDHAVINAGIAISGALSEVDFADWRRLMDVNLDGAFLSLATAMRVMNEGGGSAVVVSSTTGVKPVPGIGPYGVAKAAVAHMARIAALDGAAQNIRVNAIAPGGVDTAIWDSSDAFRELEKREGRQAALKAMAASTPRGKFATAEEIAGSILFLLGDEAANITGHIMVSDGGYTL